MIELASRPGKETRFDLNQSKARDLLAVNLDGLEKHAQRPHPHPEIAVQRLVKHHFFFGFGVPGNTEYAVLGAFVMAIETWL